MNHVYHSTELLVTELETGSKGSVEFITKTIWDEKAEEEGAVVEVLMLADPFPSITDREYAERYCEGYAFENITFVTPMDEDYYNSRSKKAVRQVIDFI